MKTEVALEFTEWLIKQKEQAMSMAKSCACRYAETDEASHKAAYERYNQVAQVYSEVFNIACQALHALERMIPDKEASND